MKQPFKPIPYNLYTEWRVPDQDRYEFSYDDVENKRFILIASDIKDFVNGINDILHGDGSAYLRGSDSDIVLHVDHLQNTFVSLKAWNVIKPKRLSWFSRLKNRLSAKFKLNRHEMERS